MNFQALNYLVSTADADAQPPYKTESAVESIFGMLKRTSNFKNYARQYPIVARMRAEEEADGGSGSQSWAELN